MSIVSGAGSAGSQVAAAADDAGIANVRSNITMAEEFVLAGVAAAVSKTVTAPIERVNLRSAVSSSEPDTSAIRRAATVFRRVAEEQGVLSFWRGNVGNVTRYCPKQALNFMFNDFYKPYLAHPRSSSFGQQFIGAVASGGAAGATSLLVVYPIDFARTRLAMDVGVYNGFVVACAGTVLYRGAYFGLYDTINDQDFMRTAGFVAKFGVGYAAAVVAGLIAYPIDTIRRRMITTSYTSSIAFSLHVLRNEGVRAMYTGARSNVISGFTGGLVLVCFDYFKNSYRRMRTNATATSSV